MEKSTDDKELKEIADLICKHEREKCKSRVLNEFLRVNKEYGGASTIYTDEQCGFLKGLARAIEILNGVDDENSKKNQGNPSSPGV